MAASTQWTSTVTGRTKTDSDAADIDRAGRGGARWLRGIAFDGETIYIAASDELPAGTHNAQPFRNGVLFNDSKADRLRSVDHGNSNEDRAMAVPKYSMCELENAEFDDRVARQGFARGLAVISETVVAGGSSPSTVVVYDLAGSQRLVSVNISMDIRNAIHGGGLAVRLNPPNRR